MDSQQNAHVVTANERFHNRWRLNSLIVGIVVVPVSLGAGALFSGLLASNCGTEAGFGCGITSALGGLTTGVSVFLVLSTIGLAWLVMKKLADAMVASITAAVFVLWAGYWLLSALMSFVSVADNFEVIGFMTTVILWILLYTASILLYGTVARLRGGVHWLAVGALCIVCAIALGYGAQKLVEVRLSRNYGRMMWDTKNRKTTLISRIGCTFRHAPRQRMH